RWAAYNLALPIDPVQSWLARTYSGVAVRYPPRDRAAHPLQGGRLPHGSLTGPDGATMRLYELFHDGRFVLIIRPPGEIPPDLPSQVKVVPYSGSRREGWPAAVLVRPDGYVAWAGDQVGPDDVRAGVREWISVR